MNVLDIVLIVCFLLGLIVGIRKGLIGQLIGLVSVILGICLAYRFFAALSVWLKTALKLNVQNDLLNLISFGVILILVILVLALVGKALEGLVRITLLGWLNRLLGAVFSLMTTFLVIGLLILFLHHIAAAFEIETPAVLKDSVLYNWLKDATLNIFPQLKALFLK